MTTAGRPTAVARPPGRDVAWLTVGVAAISTSGPLIVATAAPALGIAFWRNAFGLLVVGSLALLRHPRELLGVRGRPLVLGLVGGAFLAAHFATWIPSLDHTSVASSTALLATQPAWTALFARWRGQAVPGRAWGGMGVAFVGVLVITGVDVSLSRDALWGDLLSLAGAAFAAAYVTVGADARRSLGTLTYTSIVYASTSVLLLAACLISGTALGGWSGTTWGQLLLLTAGAQLLGHTVFNHVLRTTVPIVISMAILLEMPTSSLVAWAWLGQVPPVGVLPGAALLLAGIAVMVSASPAGSPATSAPVE